MSLRSAAETVDSRIPGPKCSVAVLRLSLDDLDLKTLDAWLEPSSGKSSVWISNVLAADGKRVDGRRVSDGTIARHRKGACSCAV